MIASAWKGSSSTSSSRIMSGPGVNAGFGAGCNAIGGRSADGRRAWLATAYRSWRFCFFDELSDASDLASSDEDLAAALPLDELRRQPRHLARLPVQLSVTRRSLIHAERDTPEEADGDIGDRAKAGELRDRGLSSNGRWLGDASTLCAGRVHLWRVRINCAGRGGVQAAVDGGADEAQAATATLSQLSRSCVMRART